jgi:hypothetical protein
MGWRFWECVFDVLEAVVPFVVVVTIIALGVFFGVYIARAVFE